MLQGIHLCVQSVHMGSECGARHNKGEYVGGGTSFSEDLREIGYVGPFYSLPLSVTLAQTE